MGGAMGTPSSSSSRPDPTVQRLNTFYADQLDALKKSFGGYEILPSVIRPENELVTTVDRQGNVNNAAANAVLVEQYKRAMQNPWNDVQALGYETATKGLTDASTLYDLGLKNSYNWYQNAMTDAQKSTDPTAGLTAAKDYMSQIAEPQITNQLTAAGQGRSGALTEALANAGAQMALPIWQQTNQNQFGMGNLWSGAALGMGNLANEAAKGKAQMYGDIGSKEMNLGTILDSVQTQRLNDAFNAAMFNQNAMYQENMRAGNQIIGLLGGLPTATPGFSKSEGASEGWLGTVMQVVGMAAMGAAMA